MTLIFNRVLEVFKLHVRAEFRQAKLDDLALVADCRRDPDVCDLNARCQRRGSEYFCVCLPGYHGDGYDQCTGIYAVFLNNILQLRAA